MAGSEVDELRYIIDARKIKLMLGRSIISEAI
jgi:hypothetical protein